MQNDGNVVIYFNAPRGTRPSGFKTDTTNGHHFRMQMDGNLALYKADGSWAWNSKTGGRPYDMGYKLILTETGRAQVFDRNNTLVFNLQANDLSPANGGAAATFPFFRLTGTTCNPVIAPQQFQSGVAAQEWAMKNGATVGYCNHPYN